jgi:hypothetical protein
LCWRSIYFLTQCRVIYSGEFPEYRKNNNMAHWFHRNPLKATSRVSFELRQVSSTTSCRQLCRCDICLFK